jgi:hypothetical protein
MALKVPKQLHATPTSLEGDFSAFVGRFLCVTLMKLTHSWNSASIRSIHASGWIFRTLVVKLEILESFLKSSPLIREMILSSASEIELVRILTYDGSEFHLI